MTRISNEISNPLDYISFFGLRAHSVMPNGSPATEMIYVHSKMMIVDDRMCLIGSANINDRSLVGDRDSELAVLVEDTHVVESRMSGQPFTATRFAHLLRTKCFQQLFGFSEAEMVIDPLDPKMWRYINIQVQTNTRVYREVFGCYPDEQIRSYEGVELLARQARPELYYELSPQIRGRAVEWPLAFMDRENLRKAKNFQLGLLITPNHLFT